MESLASPTIPTLSPEQWLAIASMANQATTGPIPAEPDPNVTPDPPLTWAGLFPNRKATAVQDLKLHYIAPKVVEGVSIMEQTPEMVADGMEKWERCLVGFFPGISLPYALVRNLAEKQWGEYELEDVMGSKGIFYFRFSTIAKAREVLSKGPWMLGKRAIILQQWERDRVFIKDRTNKVPVWIKLHHLPLHLWSLHGLSAAASQVGSPLVCDENSLKGTHVGYARVCVMLDAATEPLKSFVVKPLTSTGMYVEVHIEYEWLPKRCSTCRLFGHNCAQPKASAGQATASTRPHHPPSTPPTNNPAPTTHQEPPPTTNHAPTTHQDLPPTTNHAPTTHRDPPQVLSPFHVSNSDVGTPFAPNIRRPTLPDTNAQEPVSSQPFLAYVEPTQQVLLPAAHVTSPIPDPTLAIIETHTPYHSQPLELSTPVCFLNKSGIFDNFSYEENTPPTEQVCLPGNDDSGFTVVSHKKHVAKHKGKDTESPSSPDGGPKGGPSKKKGGPRS